MKRRLIFVAMLVVLLLSTQSLGYFQESRWQIMDLLAYPDKIEKGFRAYSLSKQSWKENDLGDGIRRWMAQPAKLYHYELIGTPIKSAAMVGIITDDPEQVNRLKTRAILLMRAVETSIVDRAVDGVWRGKKYKTKQIEVYGVEEDTDLIVITVVVKYF